MKPIFIFMMLITSSFFLTCRQNHNDASDAAQTSTSMPADFESFYQKFAIDTAYQMRHIIFPLEGRPALKDGMDNIPENFKWQKSQWIHHKAYDDMNGTFSRSFLNFEDIITEEIKDNSGQFTMLRRFAKMDNEWYLIFYKEMGR